jgi:hypothetical protein
LGPRTSHWSDHCVLQGLSPFLPSKEHPLSGCPAAKL